MLSLQCVYAKAITPTHFHLQIRIHDKLYFFAVQMFKHAFDLYDAKNGYLHNYSNMFLEYADNVPSPKCQEHRDRENIDAITHFISQNKWTFLDMTAAIKGTPGPSSHQQLANSFPQTSGRTL